MLHWDLHNLVWWMRNWLRWKPGWFRVCLKRSFLACAISDSGWFRVCLTIFVTCDLERKQYNIYTIILSGSIIFLQGNILPCIPPLQCKACNFLGFDYLRNNYLRMISYETISFFFFCCEILQADVLKNIQEQVDWKFPVSIVPSVTI